MDKLLANASVDGELNPVKQHFTKQQRLLVPADFKQVFDNISFKIHQSHLMCFVRTRPQSILSEQTESRIGLAITKKKVKRAHDRNRIKRLTREYFRLHQHQLIVPVDVVLTIKQSPESLSNADIYQQLKMAFEMINRKLKSSTKATSK